MSASQDGNPPADRCPYARPFPNDFVDCPAYVPRRWPIHSLNEQRLGVVWTCWHLTEGRASVAEGRFYPRCALGDQKARLHWTETAGEAAIAAYRAFRQAVGAVDDELMAAAAAPAGRPIYSRDRHRLLATRRQTIERLMAELREAAEGQAHILAGSGLAPGDWIAVTEAVFEHAASHSRQPWRPSAELFASLTPAGRRLVAALAAGPGRAAIDPPT